MFKCDSSAIIETVFSVLMLCVVQTSQSRVQHTLSKRVHTYIIIEIFENRFSINKLTFERTVYLLVWLLYMRIYGKDTVNNNSNLCSHYVPQSTCIHF